MVTKADITGAIDALQLSQKPVCVHASLKSFGYVEGGARAVVESFLERGCTLLVPAFTYDFRVPPPAGVRPRRNAYDYDALENDAPGRDRVFTVDQNDIAGSLGAIPRAVVEYPGRKRGYNPLNSFAALGDLAGTLVDSQSASDVYAPFKRLCELDGRILLMGVGLTRMTAIHYAEEAAGRRLFVRWANGPDGRMIAVSTGSCSAGFGRFEDVLKDADKRMMVGESLWRAFSAGDVIDRCAAAIRRDPAFTHCSDPDCARCNDAAQGGPILDE